MGKRSASGVGLTGKLRAVFTGIRSARLPRATEFAVFNRKELAQPLEPRLMLSSAPNIVTVDWHGSAITAYQDQYVAETQHPELLQSLAAKKGFTALTSLGGDGYYSFSSTLPVTTLQKLASKDKLTFKVLAPNAINHLASTVADDPEITNQWGLINSGQLEPYDYNGDGVVTPYNYLQNPTPPSTIEYPSPPYPNENHYGTVGDDLDVSNAWDYTTGSKNVVVAILDSGIDLTHPDLAANIWTNPLDTTANNNDGDGFADDVNGWNFVDSDNDVQDTFGHGTAVAGIIGAAGNNQLGISGVNWNVNMLSVVVADDTGVVTDANEISGINYVVMLKNLGINIVVMNQSIGFQDEFPQNLLLSSALSGATKAGILSVVAAGNDGDPGPTDEVGGELVTEPVPSGVNLDSSQITPGSYSLSNPNVITVAATDNQGKLASFSNYGQASVQLAAPGVDIYTTSPVSESILSEEISIDNPDIPQFDASYGYLSGTSVAAPFVTGIIALEAAANPTASPAQLKQALLQGVTFDPALAGNNDQPAKVATSGVANAYKAVQNILNDFVSANTVRQGSWVNYYGGQGAYVVGDSTSFPSFVTVDQTGGSPVIIDNTTRNLAALQRQSDPTERISAYEAAATSESINLDFTDGLVHQTTLYLADLDRKRRTETVQLFDNATGLLLDSESVSNFTKGEYLTYDLRGNVSLTILNGGGPSAVYSGLFFDTTTTQPATYQGSDTTTTGANWRNAYGSQGAVVVGDATDLPSYVSSYSVAGGSQNVLAAQTHNSIALQKVTDVNSNIEGDLSSSTYMDLNLSTNDGLAHLVTLYFADYGNKHRQERIQLYNSTGNVLAQQDISNFTKGVYVSFQITGAVTFRIIDTAGPSAVVSGLFFDAPFGQKAHYAGTDTTTGGNWQQSQYGVDTGYIVGDNFPGVDDPANSYITSSNANEDVLTKLTNNRTAVNTGTTSQGAPLRTEAYLYTNSTMEFSYNPGDDLIHTVALYFADYQNYHRQETVTVYDPATLKVVTSQTIANFSKGKYLVLDISGEALITISNGTYPNAVLSGIFTT